MGIIHNECGKGKRKEWGSRNAECGIEKNWECGMWRTWKMSAKDLGIAGGSG